MRVRELFRLMHITEKHQVSLKACVNTNIHTQPTHFTETTKQRTAKNNRGEIKREPLSPLKMERATEMGMIHDMTPSSFSPNVTAMVT